MRALYGGVLVVVGALSLGGLFGPPNVVHVSALHWHVFSLGPVVPAVGLTADHRREPATQPEPMSASPAR